jgi:restriction system protein
MARKAKSSPAEDFVDLIAMLPWWVGCGLAVVSYLWLHQAASKDVTIAYVAGQAGTMMLPSIWKGIAQFGQYFAPVLCILGAAISAYRRQKRKGLIAAVANGPAADAIHGISWQEFELLVGESFRQQGFTVAETGGGGADGGVDLTLRKGGEKFLVQCKQWKAFTVGVTVVRELYGVMAAQGATGGFVVTSGRFTNDAKAFADGRNIKLIDGAALTKVIKRPNSPGSAHTVPVQAVAQIDADALLSCPACGKTMVKRTAKKGASAGKVFWGCSSYPACRGTRPIE